jgi:hypothetical protein
MKMKKITLPPLPSVLSCHKTANPVRRPKILFSQSQLHEYRQSAMAAGSCKWRHVLTEEEGLSSGPEA